MSNHSNYYTRTAQYLHWIMAIIFIGAWLIGFYSGNFLTFESNEALKSNAIDLHKNIATTIIFLIIIRIFWRYTHPAPNLPDSMSPTMKKFAHVGHLALYLILVALPISGCMYSWSAGHPAPVLYLFDLPRLVSENPRLMAITHPVHVYLSWFSGLIVIGHILAALKHHFIDKDHVLDSMIKKNN